MIQRREIVKCILLSLVTCGIYGLYWYICIVNDLNAVSNDANAPDGVKVVLFTIITCGIYGWLWVYKAGDQLYRAQNMRGMPAENRQVLFIILQVFGLSIVNYILIQSELNNLAN